MAEPSTDWTIFDEREESLLSLKGGIPTFRIGHFLKPSVPSINHPLCNLTSDFLSSITPHSNPGKNKPLKVLFKGWRNPSGKWTKWVDRMRSQYQSMWDQVGIHEAIMNSTYKIHRDTQLVQVLAEKWCSGTNTFVFPWGESTLSLEDLVILGGFSVLGHPVSSPMTNEIQKINDKLLQARLEVTRTKAAKASQSVWIRKFMESGREIEHEAFLVLWLSRFVFPAPSFDTVNKVVFPIAIHLARGTKIALAPALLASIYRDLSKLKNKSNECKEGGVSSFAVWSPFLLVQIWAWERFPTLRRIPNSIKKGETRLSRWHNVKKQKTENVGLAIDLKRERFLWRPYATGVKPHFFDKFYREKGEWIEIGPDLDEELESFVRCLRVSKLVGVDCCVEHYLPHRVAMQFGMDQDLPSNVDRSYETPEIAWENYDRPIRDIKMYIPPRLFEADVTYRYLKWWGKMMCSGKGLKKGGGGRTEKSDVKKGSERNDKSCDWKMKDNHPLVPPGFSPKCIGEMETNNDSIVPMVLTPVCNRAEGEGSIDEDKQTLAELVRRIRSGGNKFRKGTELQNPPSFSADNESLQSMESKKITSEPIIEELEIFVCESRDESPVENDLTSKNIQEESCIHQIQETSVLEFEARIMKLEKTIAMLKAQRFGKRFESTPSKDLSQK